MSKLPAEIEHQILKMLPTTADRAAMALTCKTHAKTFETLKTKKVVKIGKDGKPVLGKNGQEQTEYFMPRSARMTRELRLEVLIRLNSWMGRGYRLCYACVQYINLSDPHQVKTGGGTWGGDTRIITQRLADKKARIEGPRCPLCRINAYTSMAKHKPVYTKYFNRARRVKLD